MNAKTAERTAKATKTQNIINLQDIANQTNIAKATNTINSLNLNYNMQMIDINKILPAVYQRPTKVKHVNKIVKDFDEYKLTPIIVSQHGSKYHVIDGAHRVEALRMLSFTEIMARVFTGLTQEQEAELFRTQNENVSNLTGLDFYKAGLIANNADCLTIQKILAQNGFIASKSNNAKSVACVQTLHAILREYSEDILNTAFDLIARTWQYTSKQTTRREFLIGISEFIKRYKPEHPEMTKLFPERMHDKLAAIIFEYTQAVRDHYAIRNRQRTIKDDFCKIIVEQYNKGLRKNQNMYLHPVD